MLEIIPHNIKNDPPPLGALSFGDDNSDDDSFAESPHAETEGYFYNDVLPAALPTPLRPEAHNIAPEGATVPINPSSDGAISSPEGDNNQNHVWTQDNDNRLSVQILIKNYMPLHMVVIINHQLPRSCLRSVSV